MYLSLYKRYDWIQGDSGPCSALHAHGQIVLCVHGNGSMGIERETLTIEKQRAFFFLFLSASKEIVMGAVGDAPCLMISYCIFVMMVLVGPILISVLPHNIACPH